MKNQETLEPGQRIRVADRYYWAQGAIGTILEPIDAVKSLDAGWNGAKRVVPAAAGPLAFVWVAFDEPQFDADGDGPYVQAEIDRRFITAEGGETESVPAVAPTGGAGGRRGH